MVTDNKYILEFETLDDAEEYVYEVELKDEDYLGDIFGVCLDDATGEDFRSMAEFLDDRCCGLYNGVFRIGGGTWFLACDYGH